MNEKILEEFDKKTIGGGGMTWEEVRQFLTAKLDQARTEERERVRGEIEKYSPKSLDTGVAGKIEESILQRAKADILSSLDPLTGKE